MADIVQRDVFSARQKDVTVLAATTIVIPPINLLRFDKKTFSVKNLGSFAWASANLQATSVEVPGVAGVGPGPSGDAADWEDIDTTTFATLAAGAYKSKQISTDSRKWWRLIATVSSTASIARAYVDAASI